MTKIIIEFITIALFAGSFYAVIGVLIDNILYRAGIARKKTGLTIFAAYFLAFIKVFTIPDGYWMANTLIFISLVVFYLHRGDIWTTKDHGRWWWKSQD